MPTRTVIVTIQLNADIPDPEPQSVQVLANRVAEALRASGPLSSYDGVNFFATREFRVSFDVEAEGADEAEQAAISATSEAIDPNDHPGWTVVAATDITADEQL
jgi:hypothetical protein